MKVSVVCGGVTNMTAVIDYPFAYSEQVCRSGDVGEKPIYISGDMSSDSQFFVATGVLSMLYCLFIIAVYGFIDQMYKDKPEFPMADFILTTLLAIFWLSGSAAWSNGTSALKSMTDIDLAVHCSDAYKNCTYLRSSFSSLNISLVREREISFVFSLHKLGIKVHRQLNESEEGIFKPTHLQRCFSAAGLPQLLPVGQRPVVPVQGDALVPEPHRWWWCVVVGNVAGRWSRQHLSKAIDFN